MLKPTAPPILKHGLAVLWQCNQCHISMCVVYIVRHVACVVWVVGVCFSKYSDRWSVFAPNISTASGSYVALHCKEMICDAYAWWSNKGRDEREGGKREGRRKEREGGREGGREGDEKIGGGKEGRWEERKKYCFYIYETTWVENIRLQCWLLHRNSVRKQSLFKRGHSFTSAFTCRLVVDLNPCRSSRVGILIHWSILNYQ